MRDILILLAIFASLPFVLKDPINGVLMWVLVSVMNPHTQGWGYAQHFPVAMIIAICTFFSILKAPQSCRLPWTPETILLLTFIWWMNITTLFAMFPNAAWTQWGKVMKIMLMNLVTLMVLRERADIQRLIGVIVLSLGFYGVKGGIFTLRTGGADLVWGPEDTFIGDNNALALALIVTIPLMRYLQLATHRKWLKHGMTATMLLSAVATLGSYSRGALLAIGAMLVYMWLKSRHKLLGGALLLICVPLVLVLMPERWSTRMDSINSYQEDDSAMGRINAWRMAFNLASDRFFGGGFEVSEPLAFFLYAPVPSDVHAAHSIYFQALGEHGYVGLVLYMLLGLFTWRSATVVVRQAAMQEEFAWAGSLARMIQASMVGFAVGGAFLSLLYYDVPYYLMAAVVAMRAQLRGRVPNTTV
ncbi:putative O-glycosylation ligase, exosortase A system-associated [Pseudoduganella sp. RAF53_2]|uniref:putative O-glycosylation ligase, exosortase A system-associated n=1 Tax=unclassified Pseudoduganella TaxID=2637179 RepID=UPI003F9915C9